jgi:hypothetical protein
LPQRLADGLGLATAKERADGLEHDALPVGGVWAKDQKKSFKAFNSLRQSKKGQLATVISFP